MAHGVANIRAIAGTVLSEFLENANQVKQFAGFSLCVRQRGLRVRSIRQTAQSNNFTDCVGRWAKQSAKDRNRRHQKERDEEQYDCTHRRASMFSWKKL